MDFSILPTVNAALNSTSTLLLLLGYLSIKRKRVTAHVVCMIGAIIVSALFLTSYLIYHYNHGSTSYTGTGIMRPIYFTILISHTILATAVVPLVLRTVYLAWRKNYTKHIRWARWTWPIWMYVSITGVVVYWMLYRM